MIITASSSRNSLAVKVGARFFDAALRRQALDSFHFRPISIESTSVSWKSSSKKTPSEKMHTPLSNLENYHSPFAHNDGSGESPV